MDTHKEILKLEKKIAALRAKSARSEVLRKKTAMKRVSDVVKQFGFSSIHELLEIADTAVVATSTKRKRSKITNAIRAKVVKLLKKGLTAGEAAAKTGISVASVAIIKARSGLTKPRNSTKVAKAIKKLAARSRRPRSAKAPKPQPAATEESPLAT